jgi:hypothetical protein
MKRPKKPDGALTTEEAFRRLFPKPVRKELERTLGDSKEPEKPRKSPAKRDIKGKDK